MQFREFVGVKKENKYLVSWALSCYMSLVLLSFGIFLRLIRHFKMPVFFFLLFQNISFYRASLVQITVVLCPFLSFMKSQD